MNVMITPKEIKQILAQKKFKQKSRGFGFDAGIVGLGVGQKNKSSMKMLK